MMPPTICCVRSQSVRDLLTEISGGATPAPVRCGSDVRALALSSRPKLGPASPIVASWCPCMWAVVWLIAAHIHTHPWADFRAVKYPLPSTGWFILNKLRVRLRVCQQNVGFFTAAGGVCHGLVSRLWCRWFILNKLLSQKKPQKVRPVTRVCQPATSRSNVFKRDPTRERCGSRVTFPKAVRYTCWHSQPCSLKSVIVSLRMAAMMA